MIRTFEERTLYLARCVAHKAKPDYNVVVFADAAFCRSRALLCPWCGALFFAYQPELSEPRAPEVEPEPPRGKGHRRTCGHPLCHAQEVEHHGRRVSNPGPTGPGLRSAA